jgi:hypothetical protein
MRFVLVTLLGIGLSAGACKKDEDNKAAAQKPDQPADNPADKPADNPADKPEEKPAADPKLIERGAYLSNMMGCPLCHTPMGPQGPDMSKAFAGGLEIPEEFGTWRSPNITQDKETGIGGWTDEQIIAAIREGKRPDGENLFPVMPYLMYNVLSDDDAKAMVAFLRTIPAVSNKVERLTDLKLPKIPAPPAKGLPASTDDPVAHGAYNASLMHCVMCHTPMTEKGPDMSKAFAGGMKFSVPMFGEGDLYAPNLTPDATGIKDYSDEDLMNAIMKMKKKDGTMIQGPMAMYQGTWSQLQEDDVKHVIAFLRTLKPIKNKIPKSTFKPKAPPAAPPK